MSVMDEHVEAHRKLNAHIISLVQVLVDIGIIKPEQYEAKLAANLAAVDQFATEVQAIHKEQGT